MDLETVDIKYLAAAQEMSNQSTCLRRYVGAVIVKDGAIIATGYNGAPEQVKPCKDTGCLRQKLNIPSGEHHEICRGVHAEQRAINYAARYGISIDGATIYCNTKPCSMCAKSIVNSGIITVIYEHDYPDPLSDEFLSAIKSIKIGL